jgi:hypothetical protein
MPVDTFVDAPILGMQVVDGCSKEYPLFAQMLAMVETEEGRPVRKGVLERFAFYEAAKKIFRDHSPIQSWALRLFHPPQGRQLKKGVRNGRNMSGRRFVGRRRRFDQGRARRKPIGECADKTISGAKAAA